MPWFVAKPFSPVWGWHWTMGKFDPDSFDEDRRRIASRDYPLIGPYDSADPDVLEYHALLMKIAGIDGAVIDWYGTADFLDYGLIHRNTARWIETLKRFGLRYALCYEDQSLKHLVEGEHLSREQALARAKADFRWMAENAFGDPLYAKWKGVPLLLVYGPQFLSPEELKTLLSGLPAPPALFALDERKPPAAGTFAWPPMWKSQGKTLTLDMLDEYLNRFYAGTDDKIGIVFPGFHDIYAEAGVGPSYGFSDRDGGSVLRRTLDKALGSGAPFAQIATWNDFGEGTDIEPTREYGYRALEILQNAARSRNPASFPYRASDLRSPLQIYRLRKRGDPKDAKPRLDRVVRDLIAGRVGDARKGLEKLSAPLKKTASQR
jgi:hypothetical protein